MSSPHTRRPVAVPSRRDVLRRAASLAVAGPALTALGGTGATAATRTAASLDFEGVTLKVLCNTPHLSMYNNFLAPAWQRLTGGTLQARAVDYTQLADTIIQDVRSGTAEFDCFDYYYYMLGSIADAGALVDLTRWIAAQDDLDTGDFLRSVYDPYTVHRNRRYGLPYDGDQHLVFYNEELLGTYGLEPRRLGTSTTPRPGRSPRAAVARTTGPS